MHTRHACASKGDAKLIDNFPGTTGAEVTGYHNPNKLVPPPPGKGEISWVGNFKESNPLDPNNSYTQGKVQRNMSDFIDPRTGNPWEIAGSSMKIKKQKNVFWPKSYSTQRINEEMAYAYSNIDLDKKVISAIDKYGEKTYIYQSSATDGHVIEVMFYGGDRSSGKLISIYPQYF